ncbi:DUF503 domain-containing protein [Pseudogracilibacillus auburnensis]|uniref:DUF503 domain-containing protein n=1 Tax=Pseudogracilibacillus auburnensis TaxID=1494959 RepID=A0A2V3WIN4_9BACI|nr:DUF503 domain-containing protein [Pseudogracilibacillus auburnensis]MBO1003765.1 DUF503 domain-containing protein [Pseudogracilibacillus auburnensis]PXW88649.1 hypothetical protein DFR56_103154 [Pseudogracilibacillus auburnensis]
MILYAEIECILYHTHSLKAKRSILKRLIAKIRKDFNVSISEIDYQDLWQRTKLAIVTVSNELKHAEKVMQEVLKLIDHDPELERTITTIDRL